MAEEELRAHVKLTGDTQFKQQMKDVGDSTDKAGDSIHDLGKETNFLAKEAEKAEVKVKDLIKTLNETGDVALLKEIRKGKRELRLFEGLKKELEAEVKEAAIEVASPSAGGTGGIIGEGLAKGMGAAIAAGGPYLIAGLATLAAGAAPFLGGVIASAVIGGVGLGGIAGGLALAAQDSRVKGAAEKLGGIAMSAFSDAAEPFIAPAIEAIGLLGRAATDVADTMKPAFASLAPVLMPFTQGLVGLVEDMMPGLIKGFEAAKPVIRAIANELPDIGEAVGDMIAMMGEDTDGAVEAFAALSDIIQFTLRTTGALVMNLSKIYEASVEAGVAVTGLFEGIFRWAQIFGPLATLLSELFGKGNDNLEDLRIALHRSGDGANDFTGDIEGVGDAAEDAAAQIDAMKRAMDAAFGKTMDIQQATIAYERAIDDLTESVQENGRSLDARDEKGRANRGAILDEIQAIKDLRDANIDNGMSIEEANATYDRQLESLRKTAISLFKNKDAVNELINAFDGMPNLVEVEIRAPGLLAAIANSRELIRLLGSTAAYASSKSDSYVSGRASGGPVMAGQTYVVGENGPEILQMGATGGNVINATDTAAMMSGASGGASGGTMTLIVSPKPGADAPLMSAIVSNLQFEVQTTGEGSAQLYFAGR